MRYLIGFVVLINLTPFLIYNPGLPKQGAITPLLTQLFLAVFGEMILCTILVMKKMSIHKFSLFEKHFSDAVLASIDTGTKEHVIAMNKDLLNDFTGYMSFRDLIIMIILSIASISANVIMFVVYQTDAPDHVFINAIKFINVFTILLVALYAHLLSTAIGDFQRQVLRMGNMCTFYAGQELKKSKIFYAITDILRLFNKQQNLKTTLRRILEEAKETLNMDIAILEINEKKTGTFYRLTLPEDSIVIGDELLTHIKGNAQLVRNIKADPFLRPLVPEDFHNFIYTPLFSGDGETVAGYITGFSKQNIWQDSDLALLRMLAMQANILLNNAALFEEVQKLSITDGLTGLYNRRYFKRGIENEVNRAVRYSSTVCLLMIDIDHFKNYNDTNGHPAGDGVLQVIAEIMEKMVRETDIVARYGGEEFSIILPETDKDGAAKLAERLRKRVEDEPFSMEERQPGGKVTISVGVAAVPDDADNAKDLIDRADEKLYEAKESGRNKVCVTDT